MANKDLTNKWIAEVAKIKITEWPLQKNFFGLEKED